MKKKIVFIIFLCAFSSKCLSFDGTYILLQFRDGSLVEPSQSSHGSRMIGGALRIASGVWSRSDPTLQWLADD